MNRFRGLLKLVWVLGVLAQIGGEARAGSLTVTLTWGTASNDTLSITPDSLYFAQSGSTNDDLTLNTSYLNAYLLANGSALQFSSGSSFTSNYSTATQTSGAELIQSASVYIASGVTGSTDMTIDVTLTDWTAPSGSTGLLSSSVSAFFEDTGASDSLTFSSFYSPPDPGTIPIILTPSVSSGSTSVSVTPTITPFTLTNSIQLSLTNTGIPSESLGYNASTTVSVTPLSGAVPEPSTLLLLVQGAAALLGLAWRGRRKLRTAAA